MFKSPGFALFAAVSAVLFFIVSYTFSQVFGNALADVVVGWIGAASGTSREEIAAIIGRYVIPAGVAGICLLAMFYVARWYVERIVYGEDPRTSALDLAPMEIAEIAEYVRDKSVWSWQTFRRLNYREAVKDHTAAEMKRAGLASQVRFVGTTAMGTTAEIIDPTYWRFCGFDDDRIWDRRNEFFTSSPRIGNSAMGLAHYRFGKAPRIDVVRAWPRASKLRIILTWLWVKLKIMYWGVTGRIEEWKRKWFVTKDN